MNALRRFNGPLRSLLTLTILAWPLTVFPQAEQSPVTTVTADSYPIANSRDWEGLKRDTWYFMGAQVGSLGILYLMPEAVTNWSEEQKDNFSLSKWRENMSHPHLDKDDFYLNYILHPYWGATYYVRARERGYEKLNAFWYSAFLSTFYEAGPEALFEQPSIQDLVITPVFGAWLGEYFMGVRNQVRERATERGYRTRGETWIWYLTDPLNLINTTLARVFDKDTRLSLQPLVGVPVGIPGAQGPAGWPGWHPDNSGNTAIAVSRSLAGQHPALQRAYRADRQRLRGLSLTLTW